ncbi:MAG TPA: metallophosphoesterase [Syntrophales bacterium]|nr:metallophosphoesterase [Syntrophales bacterium]HQB14215.1 metallophosphoesterase [Syntrophales bacterium]
MILFLLTFFFLYGGLHLYFFLRLRAAFSLPVGLQITVGPLLLLLLVSPLLVRMAERQGYEAATCIMAYTGYLWMGFIFLFFVVSVCLDLYRLAVFLNERIGHQDLSHLFPPARIIFLGPLVIAIILNVYGYYEAMSVRPEHLVIKTAKLPAQVEKFRIVQISDLHIGMIVRDGRLKRFLAAVEAAAPDVLVSTGDLVDSQLDNLYEALARLKNVPVKYGKFAVTGNHEFFAGVTRAVEFTEKAGFTVLRGEGVNVAGIVNIAGVDDPAVTGRGGGKQVREAEFLSSLPPGVFTVLLKHQPVADPDAEEKFDLQLSGHTHRGQIFPFNMVTKFVYYYHSGDFYLPDGARLHVSRGTGTWGPPVRLLAPPEITVIDLVRK